MNDIFSLDVENHIALESLLKLALVCGPTLRPRGMERMPLCGEHRCPFHWYLHHASHPPCVFLSLLFLPSRPF